jgi:hypothetical protein
LIKRRTIDKQDRQACRDALGSPAFNCSYQDKEIIERAGGIKFDDGDWFGIWVVCDAFAAGAVLGNEPVLSEKEMRALEAVTRSGIAMVNAITRLSPRSSSLLQAAFSKEFFPEGHYNALSPTTPQLVSPERILEWSVAAKNAQLEARLRKKGEREHATNARAFVSALRELYDELVVSSSGTRPQNAGFTNFFKAIYARLPREAQQRLTTPEAALKLTQRKRREDK